ncbi:carboxypeptidase-like regulatory domain-containing protein, partial [Gelidibacter sp.]|uniref:carboxypeptidase-like regulatory domain-containing protein n=1 Tax=Gelidibacter sp. TaxID=2018083 RepID=UPI002D196856
MKSLILFCLIMCSTLYAQPSVSDLPKEGSISGTIIDAHLNQPLPYVTIVIKNSNNETVTGSISQDDGNFKISKIPEGQFSATIQYIGYKTIIQ